MRAHAISHTLFAPTTLPAALRRLGFVQADPIRAPARAQDLILRPRVRGYRAGDLERLYPSLDLDEDVLYAYGFLPRATVAHLHPRRRPRLTALEARVLAVVQALGEAHPNAVEARIGGGRVVNAWGGFSKATKRALEDLHDRDLVRVARRDSGIRVYAPTAPRATAPLPERLRAVATVVAATLAPVAERKLRGVVAHIARRFGARADARAVVDALVASGALTAGAHDGERFLWPAGARPAEAPRRVTLLAPFDPLVWDRARFTQLWGWTYKFEAYTPVAKRERGYYALPLLWLDRVVGWANVERRDGTLHVDVGFARGRPRERDFARELDADLARLDAFLAPRSA